ncbi:MAG TPA: hypothetical protein VNW90_25290 [Acetobacteraceae bacterium]|jgi:hypothetical protein|nr:hypothetical protein [Acetobacteraceae bacterium]
MRQLVGSRGWEYAYEKALVEQLERLRDQLESGTKANYQYLCGQIHGIRVAIKELSEIRHRFNLDEDSDVRE